MVTKGDKMTIDVKIDTRFLESRVAKKFDKGRRFMVEKAYRMALDHMVKPDELPYPPAVYVFPCIVRETVKTGNQRLRRTFDNMTFPDPEDVTRLAIFTSIYTVKRLPLKWVATSMAHEFSHIIEASGSVFSGLKYTKVRMEKGYVAMVETQERAASNVYEHFKEPIKSWLQQWDKEIEKYKKTLTEGACFIEYNQFAKKVLGEKHDKFMKEAVAKLKVELGLKQRTQ